MSRTLRGLRLTALPAALVPSLPRAPIGVPRSLLVVGALANVVEDQMRRLFAALGIEQVNFLPPRRAADLPPVGPNTSFLLAGPSLAETARVLEKRGAIRLAAPFPLGAEGTTLWLEAAANAWRVDPARFRSVTAPGQERARSALARARLELTGKRIFFFPDSQLEVPLARFLSRELGMELVEVGTPYLHRQQLTQTFVLDAEMRERLAALNPTASAKVANRPIEAHERNHWTPDPAMLEALREAGADLEDRLEGIGAGMAA